MRWYAIAPRPWIEDGEGGGYWGLPPGTIGSVDLGPLGLFATSDVPFDPGVVHTAFGDGTRLDNYTPTPLEQEAWGTTTGVPFQPGWTLLDALWAVLTTEADPEGVTGPKPIMPTSKGVLELHLGGHSLIRSEKLPEDPETHPAWPKIQQVLQNDYRAIAGRDRALARKWLGAQALKYRLSQSRARDLVIPADLPRELPLRPTTTITDDFNRADGGIGSSAEGWAWAEVGSSADYNISSNTASSVGGTSSTETQAARAESDLSSDDHYAEATITITVNDNNPRAGPAARFDASSLSFYTFATFSSTFHHLNKISGGVRTSLDNSAIDPVFPSTLRIKVDGSSLEGFIDGVSVLTVTDTSITGHTRTGLGTSRASGQGISFDDFSAADLLASIEGDLTVTDGADNASATGSTALFATLTGTEGADIAAFSGDVVVQGDISATDAADSFAATADLVVQGDLTATDGADISVAPGDVYVQGDLTATDGADNASATGSTALFATLTGTEGADIAAFSGDVVVQGDISATDAADSFAATADLVVQGDLTATDGADTAAMLSTSFIEGDLIATDGADTLDMVGVIPIEGGLSGTDGADSLTATGGAFVGGDLTATDGADALAASGVIPIDGALTSTDGADIISVEGEVPISGELAATDGADTTAAAGVIPIEGDLVGTEGADIISFAGYVNAAEGTMAAIDGADTASFTAQIIPFPAGRRLEVLRENRTITAPARRRIAS